MEPIFFQDLFISILLGILLFKINEKKNGNIIIYN